MKKRYLVGLLVLLVLLVVTAVVVVHNLTTNTVLFEDGSVRIAFCLFRSWGCA